MGLANVFSKRWDSNSEFIVDMILQYIETLHNGFKFFTCLKRSTFLQWLKVPIYVKNLEICNSKVV